jgi:P2-related tail formation protein
VLANILAARERAALVAQCLQTIKEGREALASAGEQSTFDTWWRRNGGDTPARTFERALAGVGFADGGARVVEWVRAQDVRVYLPPDQAD